MYCFSYVPLKFVISGSVTQSCPLYNFKTIQAIFMELHTNINNIRRHAECKNHNSCIDTLLSYIPLNFVSSSFCDEIMSALQL